MRFKTLFFIIAFAYMAGSSFGMNLNDTFQCITTMVITSTPEVQVQGTGFYYQHLEAIDSSKTIPQWRAVQKTWLITNRHILLPKLNGKELMPTKFAFYLRRIDGDTLRWDPITLTKEELCKRARFNKNPEIDVAVVDVHDLLVNKIMGNEKYLQWYSVSPETFAGQNNIDVQVSDDVIIIGYPRGFYDEENLFPIVKSGIIASRWGTNFNGKPYFLIDAKLFPGSSGSIVLSKPANLAVRDGQVFLADEKQFAFLGIYSGEPYEQKRPIEFEGMTITEKAGFNLGVVWYSNLIEEIISNGESLKQ